MLKRYRHTLTLALTTLLVSAPAALAADAGDIDFGFGSSGKVITDLRSEEQTNAVAVQSDGKIITAGSWGAPLRTNFSLVRYNPDGSRDGSFGSAGWVLADFDGGDDSASDVAVQPDGRILAVGDAAVNGQTRFALARYTADGRLDTSFGGDGLVTTGIPDSAGVARAVALTPGGKIVVVGRIYRSGSGSPDWAITRYESDGTLDESFSGDGILTTSFGGSYYAAEDVAVQPDGRIVVVGASFGPDQNLNQFVVARYTTAGKADPSFDGDGYANPQFSPSSSNANAVAVAVAIQPDGRIVAAGVSKAVPVLARFTPDGELDTTFDRDGLAIHSDFGLDHFSVSSLALQTDGNIVLAGEKTRVVLRSDESGAQHPVLIRDFVLARYRSSGTPDSGFGDQGMLTTAVGQDAYATGVAIQPGGKIVAAGTVEGSADHDIGLVRYHPITDNVDPQVIFDSGPTGTTNDPTPTFTFHSTKPGSSFECAIAGRPYVDCSSPYTAATLRNGVHNFRVVASDQSGNYSQVAVRSFRLDTTATPAPDPVQPVDDPPAEDVVAPDAPSPAPPAPTPEPPAAAPDAAPAAVQPTIIAGPTGKLEKRRVSFRFEVAGSAGATFECKLDASPWRACTSPQAYGQLSLGRHLFQVRVNDADGSGEAIPAKRRFRVVAH